jgi:hypothetical protein
MTEPSAPTHQFKRKERSVMVAAECNIGAGENKGSTMHATILKAKPNAQDARRREHESR